MTDTVKEKSAMTDPEKFPSLVACPTCGAISSSLNEPDPCPVCARVAAAVAAERERCAKILVDYADVSAYDPEEYDDLMAVVEHIRSGQ